MMEDYRGYTILSINEQGIRFWILTDFNIPHLKILKNIKLNTFKMIADIYIDRNK